MKSKLFLLPLLILAASAFVQAETPPPASAVLADAERAARADHKNVLVMFHASWCGWCKQLDKTLNRPDVKPIIDKNFEIVTLTIFERKEKKADENPGGVDMLKQLGGKEDGGIPFFAIVNPDGGVVANSAYSVGGKPAANMGYPNESSDIDYFMTMMDKGAPNITDADKVVLRKALDERAAEINAALKAKRAASGH